jgi:hypothetical protein
VRLATHPREPSNPIIPARVAVIETRNTRVGIKEAKRKSLSKKPLTSPKSA